MAHSRSKIVEVVGWYGAVSGIIGTVIVTSRLPASYEQAAMVFWISSSLAFLYFSLKNDMRHLFLMQAIYFALNLWGLYRWS